MVQVVGAEPVHAVSPSRRTDLKQVEVDQSASEVPHLDRAAIRSDSTDLGRVESVHLAGQRVELDLGGVRLDPALVGQGGAARRACWRPFGVASRRLAESAR